VRPVGSKYLLEEPLGRGATGTVWRGHQREAAGEEAAVPGQPGEQVAVKVLKEELANDPDVVMRFLRERSVLLRLAEAGHDNIVRTRDLVVEGEVIALVMDLIDGPDLHHYLRQNGPLSPVGAALLTAQIADALAAAHAKGIVHRDLKPANVLLAGGGDPTGAEPMRPMLTDFGIARLADSPGVTRTHEFVGTPSYVAPESAEGREQTSAVDVYGAGILLYELVTGSPPFVGASTLDVLRGHLSAQPPRPEGIPDPLWTVIERCLRKSPDERPGATSLARALRTVAAGIGDHATGEQWAAAAGVAALLLPDPTPVTVPGTGISPPGSAEPTRAMPGGSAAADPAAATSVLPHTGAPAAPGGGDADPTRVMPQGAAQPDGPHPWEEQLRAARDRNEPTRVQPIDPAQDPLYRRPQRQPQRQPRQRPPQAGYGYPPPQPAPYQQQPYPQQYAQPQPQPQPPPYQQPVPPPYAEPQPRRGAEPRRREREPRSRSRGGSPMRIPGMGCLKGCLFVVVLLVVAGWAVWNFTPMQGWIADGRSFWNATKDWFNDVREWLGLMEEAKKTQEDLQNNLPGGQ
jgi:serine/threonine-protein kinase